MDAVEAVAGAIVPDAGGRGAGTGHEAGTPDAAKRGSAHGEAGYKGDDLGVDGDGLGLTYQAAYGGQTEGIRGGDFSRADGV